jgi:DNA-binding NarL/FixJ family response regulator
MIPNEPIRLVIADDHDLFRDGLLLLLRKIPTLEVVGEAIDGETLIQEVRTKQPDVVITDLQMPQLGGAKAIKDIRLFNKQVQFIALTSFDNEDLIVDALEAGALGYVVKHATKEEVIEGINTVFSKQPFYCKSTSNKLVRLIANSSFNPYIAQQQILFDETERTIIRLICEEQTNLEIAKEVFLSDRTVEGYRARIMRKMGVRNIAGLAIYAVKNRIFEIR